MKSLEGKIREIDELRKIINRDEAAIVELTEKLQNIQQTITNEQLDGDEEVEFQSETENANFHISENAPPDQNRTLEEKFNNIFAELHELTDEAFKEGLSVEQVQKLLQ
jgi:hypothetical protein